MPSIAFDQDRRFLARLSRVRPESASGMAVETADSPQEIGFILVPGFALMSFASGCEPFRAANDLAGRPLYRLRYFGEAEGRVAASSGAEVPTEALPRQRGHLHTLFVCAGGEPTGWDRPEIHATLRRMARLGVRIGGISGGPYLMAAAGLLADRAFTLHWEYAGATVETFPDARLNRARYVADGDRLTCGGGVAPLEMAHALIAERMGEAFPPRLRLVPPHRHRRRRRPAAGLRGRALWNSPSGPADGAGDDGENGGGAARPPRHGAPRVHQPTPPRPAVPREARVELLGPVQGHPPRPWTASAAPEPAPDR